MAEASAAPITGREAKLLELNRRLLAELRLQLEYQPGADLTAWTREYNRTVSALTVPTARRSVCDPQLDEDLISLAPSLASTSTQQHNSTLHRPQFVLSKRLQGLAQRLDVDPDRFDLICPDNTPMIGSAVLSRHDASAAGERPVHVESRPPGRRQEAARLQLHEEAGQEEERRRIAR
ncbi:hypothetical protein M3Y99_01068900 [Aphelenchoides fujianensis]|nr:hypothetical protein M3Y99_01068900 [Aphelenchoides fujianensis]